LLRSQEVLELIQTNHSSAPDAPIVSNSLPETLAKFTAQWSGAHYVTLPHTTVSWPSIYVYVVCLICSSYNRPTACYFKFLCVSHLISASFLIFFSGGYCEMGRCAHNRWSFFFHNVSRYVVCECTHKVGRRNKIE